MDLIGTANICLAGRPSATALKAAIAIGCTTFGGIVDPATNKFLGTL